jgi:hypothetical protein
LQRQVRQGLITPRRIVSHYTQSPGPMALGFFRGFSLKRLRYCRFTGMIT